MRLFISYRRDEDTLTIRYLKRELERLVGDRNVFLDVHGIPPGRDFAEYLSGEIARCDALLAVIGPNWQPERLSSRRFRPDRDRRCARPRHSRRAGANPGTLDRRPERRCPTCSTDWRRARRARFPMRASTKTSRGWFSPSARNVVKASDLREFRGYLQRSDGEGDRRATPCGEKPELGGVRIEARALRRALETGGVIRRQNGDREALRRGPARRPPASGDHGGGKRRGGSDPRRRSPIVTAEDLPPERPTSSRRSSAPSGVRQRSLAGRRAIPRRSHAMRQRRRRSASPWSRDWTD